MKMLILLIVAVLVIKFLPTVLATATNLVIIMLIIAGILLALDMILKASKEKLRLQLETQKITPAGSQNSNTPATTEQSSGSDDKMNIF